MKRCSKCRVEQHLSEFTKDAKRPDGLYLWCRSCCRARAAEYRSQPGHAERQAARTKSWVERNREYVRAKAAEYNAREDVKSRGRLLRAARRAADPDGVRAADRRKAREWLATKPPEYRRELHLKQRYGLTVQQWNELFASQGMSCACCRTTQPRQKRAPWVVDHCHDTGVVRGILCNSCNRVIGWLGDDHAKAKAVAKYIERMCTQLRLPKVG